jgi:CubicO group peptidase (beta-lactamase class C family)
MLRSLCCGIFLLFVVSTYGQKKPLGQQLDELFAGHFKSAGPGCEVLVARHGQIIYQKAFGLADLELKVPLKPDMVFNLGSITKQFTAIAILQLMEQGKLSLQDSIQKFIPDYPFKGYTVTIETLLTHTSGVKDYMPFHTDKAFLERWDMTPKQLIDTFRNKKLDFEPGTRFAYSNANYYLLGYVIEKISGKTYQNYIMDKLLKPLGMSHSYFDTAGIVIPKRVRGYRYDGAAFKNADYWSPSMEYAAGGLISNVADLFKWQQGLASGKLLKKETLEKAQTCYQLKDGTASGYGYGWFIKTLGSARSIEHEGGLPGFVANEVYFPDQNIFIATLYNSESAPMGELAVSIAGLALGKPLQIDIQIYPKVFDDYTGVYQLTADTGKKMTLIKLGKRLAAKVSGMDTIPLVFQSPTRFQFKDLLDAQCEFVRENGKVTKFRVRQNGDYEWIRIR